MGGASAKKDLNKRGKEAEEFIFKNANAQKGIYLGIILRITYIKLYRMFRQSRKKEPTNTFSSIPSISY
jgi:hypothetical protein